MSTTTNWNTRRDDEGWNFPSGEDGVYETAFVPWMTRRFAPLVLDLVAPHQGDHLLDVACGTGALTHIAAVQVGTAGRVVGLDVSPGMLAAAARKTPEREDAAGIEWVEGDAGALPFADNSFDIVCCQLGLMFFPDRVGALREMARVLRPGGRAGIMTWGDIDRCPSQAVMREMWMRHFGPGKGTLFAAQHSLSDPEEMRALLEEAGFQDISVMTETQMACFDSPEMLTRAYGAGLGIEADAATRGRIIADVQQALESCVGDDGLVCPIEAVLARGDVGVATS